MVLVLHRHQLVRPVMGGRAHIIVGGSLAGNILKGGIKAVERVVNGHAIKSFFQNMFSKGKQAAITAGKDFIANNKDRVIESAKKHASDFVANKSQKLINDLSKQTSLSGVKDVVKTHATQLPSESKQVLNGLITANKDPLKKAAKKSVSKGIKSQSTAKQQQMAVDIAQELHPHTANVLSNLIAGNGLAKRRTQKGRGIKYL